MRHFVCYHNSSKIGYPVSALQAPQVFSNKSVAKLSGATVWLLSGEGKCSPKKFFLAAAFRVNRICEGTSEHVGFKNSAHGTGKIFGEIFKLNGLKWFEYLKKSKQNSQDEFTEIQGSSVI